MTDSLAWPRDALTLADWDALPEDGPRCELVEGNLHMSPAPLYGHQRLVRRLACWFEDVLPADLEVVPDGDVLCGPDPTPTVRRPDLVVVRAGLPDAARRADPDVVVGVIEVLSPGTMRTDRVAKVYDYAEAGIGWYLVVDPALDAGADARSATLFVLPEGGNAFDCVARDVAVVDVPAIGRLDVAALPVAGY